MDNNYIPIIYYIFTIFSFIIYYYNKYYNKYYSYQPVDNNDFDEQLDNIESNNCCKKNIINDIELNIPLTELNVSNEININDSNNLNNNIDVDNNIDIDNNNNKIEINKYYNYEYVKKTTKIFD
tara:strand:- start:772 stop:1143 length:372 start_codon:yes stop_codon:yes gene_type:complete